MIAALWIAFAAINAGVFALYGVDKRRAARGEWRISERTLLLGAWLLGGVGAYAGMRLFRHKTLHRAFAVGVPLAAAWSLLWMLLASARLMNRL